VIPTAACVAAGRHELARNKLEALVHLVKPWHENECDWGFNEQIQAQTEGKAPGPGLADLVGCDACVRLRVRGDGDYSLLWRVIFSPSSSHALALPHGTKTDVYFTLVATSQPGEYRPQLYRGKALSNHRSRHAGGQRRPEILSDLQPAS